jgi:hypothetical protein
MGRAKKFTDGQLAEALKEGLSGPEICVRFGVTKGALSLRLKQLNLAAGKALMLGQGEKVLANALDVRQRFVEISAKVKESAEMLEGQLKDADGNLDKGVVALYLSHRAEQRKQLEFLGKVMTDILEAQKIAQIQKIILEEIGQESAECRVRILRRLGRLESSGLLFQFEAGA